MSEPAAVHVRPATAADADAVAELLAVLGYPVEPSVVPARLDAVRAGGGTAFVARTADGRAAGLVGVQAIPVLHAAGPVAHLTALVVAPTARGQGVGRALVDAAEAWARAAGCTRLTVTSGEHRADAHAFYARVGLPYTGRRFARSLPPSPQPEPDESAPRPRP